MEFFLSYIHTDKALPGEVGRSLEASKSLAFRAHDDIKPDAEWVKEIFKHLDSCTALIAIITSDFSKSPYANQEVGYVLHRGRPVISFHFGGDLPGFLKWRQAISVSKDGIDDAVRKSIHLVAETENASPVQPPLITQQNDAKFDERGEPYRRIAISPQNPYPNLIPMSQKTKAG